VVQQKLRELLSHRPKRRIHQLTSVVPAGSGGGGQEQRDDALDLGLVVRSLGFEALLLFFLLALVVGHEEVLTLPHDSILLR
jgi:hypothetical protein